MANNYFQFKQFIVYQDACAMKVCTDACIQGAFTAHYLQLQLPKTESILDIGTGTGLLGLMLAQQIPHAQITAAELDEVAGAQATANFAASPWKERLQLVQADVRELAVTQRYDFIITNPPFYEADLKSNNTLRNQAMHATTLNYTDLLEAIALHLQPEGAFSVLLPYHTFAGFSAQAQEAGFFPQQVLHVRQSVQHDHFRSVGIFSREEATPLVESMAIREADNVYTPAFAALLQPYYLYL